MLCASLRMSRMRKELKEPPDTALYRATAQALMQKAFRQTSLHTTCVNTSEAMSVTLYMTTMVAACVAPTLVTIQRQQWLSTPSWKTRLAGGVRANWPLGMI